MKSPQKPLHNERRLGASRRARPQARLRSLVLLALSLVAPAALHAKPHERDFLVANGCSNLFVILENTTSLPLTVGYVNCTHGSQLTTLPNTNISPITPAVLVLTQSGTYGPQCQFNINNGDTVYALISVQQNFCHSQAGNITYGVDNGPATISAVQVGSWADKLPGMVWVTLN